MFWTNLLVVLLIVIYETESSSYFQLSPSDPSGLPLTYREHVLASPHSYLSHSVCSECECKNQCRIAPNCLTISVIKQGDNIECRMSQESIPDLYLTPSVGGVTFAKLSFADAPQYFLGDGGSFYHIIESGSGSAADLCRKKSPQGKLLMPKTKTQTKSVMDYRKITNYAGVGHFFTVDLHWNAHLNAIVWGDGTLYTDSEVGQIEPGLAAKGVVYALETNNGLQYFRKFDSYVGSKVMCHMNPLRVPA